MTQDKSASAGAQSRPISVAFCFDLVRKDYLAYCLTTLISLFENNKNNRLRVYIVSRSLGDADKDRIEKLTAGYSQESVFIGNIAPEYDRLIADLFASSVKSRPADWNNLPPAAWYRLLLPFLLREERVLYLDIADTIICGDLRELYETDFESSLVCGVSDLRCNEMRTLDPAAFSEDALRTVRPDAQKTRKSWSEAVCGGYINSGVMLLDLKGFDFEDYKRQLQRAATLIEPHSDQTLVNLLFRGRIKYIDVKYNFMVRYSRKFRRHLKRRDQVIVHYVGQVYLRYPRLLYTKYYFRLYYKYLDMTAEKRRRPVPKTLPGRLLRMLFPKGEVRGFPQN